MSKRTVLHFDRIRFLARVAPALALVALASGGACGGSAAPASPVADAGVDATAAVDAAPDVAATGNTFGQPCLKDSDCAVGICLASGVCTKTCATSNDCPPAPEWICNRGTCACTPSGREVCDGHDNDCDAVVDDGATCDQAKLMCVSGGCVCKPTDVCGADCFDLQTDAQHCGSCNHACPVSCFQGACAAVVHLSAGATHACARFEDGAVRCWGGNSFGQIGDGTAVQRPKPVAPALMGLEGGISAREEHTCAFIPGLSCWGEDQSGELVAPPADSCEMPATNSCVFHPTSIRAPMGVEVADVALGASHMCLLAKDGSVWCVGDGSAGQLGDGSMQARANFGQVPGIANATGISASANFTCVLLADTTMRCWGGCSAGQCGDGMGGAMRATPVQPLGLSGVIAFATGSVNTCAVVSGGGVSCWGADCLGQLGAPPQSHCAPLGTSVDAPTPVPGVTNATQVAIGAVHICARISDGTLQCWGMNRSGQLGYATTTNCLLAGTQQPCSMQATPVPMLTGVLEVEAGDEFTCARLAGADVRCWGRGDSGQRGDGSSMTGTMIGQVTW
jgi:hypothetical protein